MQWRQEAGCCPGIHVGAQLGHQEAEGLVLPGDGRPVDSLRAQGVPCGPASLVGGGEEATREEQGPPAGSPRPLWPNTGRMPHSGHSTLGGWPPVISVDQLLTGSSLSSNCSPCITHVSLTGAPNQDVCLPLAHHDTDPTPEVLPDLRLVGRAISIPCVARAAAWPRRCVRTEPRP